MIRCQACGKSDSYLEFDAWTVCLGFDNGTSLHEVFRFGPGSMMTEAQAEVQARAWVATERKRIFPGATVRLFRVLKIRPVEAPGGTP